MKINAILCSLMAAGLVTAAPPGRRSPTGIAARSAVPSGTPSATSSAVPTPASSGGLNHDCDDEEMGAGSPSEMSVEEESEATESGADTPTRSEDMTNMKREEADPEPTDIEDLHSEPITDEDLDIMDEQEEADSEPTN